MASCSTLPKSPGLTTQMTLSRFSQWCQPRQQSQPPACKKVCHRLSLCRGTKYEYVLSGRSRPHRATAGTRLAEAIAAEKLDEFGKPTPSSRRLNPPLRAHPRPSAKHKRTAGDDTGPVVINTDVEDKSFTSGSDGSSDDDSDIMDLEIGNEEVRCVLY